MTLVIEDREKKTPATKEEGWEIEFDQDSAPRRRLSEHERAILARLLRDPKAAA